MDYASLIITDSECPFQVLNKYSLRTWTQRCPHLPLMCPRFRHFFLTIIDLSANITIQIEIFWASFTAQYTSVNFPWIRHPKKVGINIFIVCPHEQLCRCRWLDAADVNLAIRYRGFPYFKKKILSSVFRKLGIVENFEIHGLFIVTSRILWYVSPAGSIMFFFFLTILILEYAHSCHSFETAYRKRLGGQFTC